MKAGIHPEYRTVVFHDTAVDKYFLIGSTLKTDRTIEWKDGKQYPYFTLDVSSESHPFYTGKQRVVKTDGRLASYSRRFGNFSSKANK